MCIRDRSYTTPYPTTASITVPISDPSGVQSATFTWAAGSGSGGGTLTSGSGSWSGTVGPVQSANVTGSGSEWSYPVNVTITARDSLGNTTVVSRPALVTVHNCTVIL